MRRYAARLEDDRQLQRAGLDDEVAARRDYHAVPRAVEPALRDARDGVLGLVFWGRGG